MPDDMTDEELDEYHDWLIELERKINAEAADERAYEREWQSLDVFPEHAEDEIPF